jgi:hypothetical protein
MNYRAAGDVKDDASGIGYAYDASYAMDVRSAEHLDLYDAIESMGLIPVAEQIMSDTLIGNDDIIDYLADQELDSELLAEM